MRALFSLCLAGGLLVSGTVLAAPGAPPGPDANVDAGAVLATYGDLAHAMYDDAFLSAKNLQSAVDSLIAAPTTAHLLAARNAWKAARVPYMQTEGFRFGNAIVDNWEGEVNSWPLDEGLIDYVAASYGTTSDENPLYTLNVIAHPHIHVGSKEIDASHIDVHLLRQLQGAQGVKENVATGYHAVEFLLWGQDLHGTGPGAGERPASDYDLKACTHEHCDRRAQYLKTATDLLVQDLKDMSADWAPGGAARAQLHTKGGDGGLATILTGIGSLSYGELAGERMKLGLILHDPEEEQDCFSDNTHNSHFYDELGMTELWRAHYTRLNGTVVGGPSLRDYAFARNPAAAKRMDARMDEALAKIRIIKNTGDSGKMAYDQMIAKGNLAGNKMVQDAIDALIAQTHADEGVVAALGLKIAIGGSDSLDNPATITR